MDVKGKKVTVVGLGQTAVALVRLLLREGAKPFVTEKASGPKYEPLRAQLDALGVSCETGGHSDEAFDGARFVIPSPGVPPALDLIRRAQSAGAQVTGEMEYAFQFCRSRLLAVTGTNGKTTTTELLRALVNSCGRPVVLAGNNAFPFSAAVMLEPVPEFIVLEVSSYQLETAREFRPSIASVLNVTPDHLARHGSVDKYAAVKSRIYANQTEADAAVINHDDPYVKRMGERLRARIVPFSQVERLENGLWTDGAGIFAGNVRVAKTSDTRLPGRHNMENVLCALAMMRAGGFDWPCAIRGLRGFRGVEHRIEFVVRHAGVDWYNDSKSTNIDSLRVALESFNEPIVLIAGGQGKGSDYRVLRDTVAGRVRRLVTIGEDAEKLEAAFGDIVAAERAQDMADAVAKAGAVAEPGNVVLLSPACASFDMFDNFEHRGRVFKECVAHYVIA
ncbi:MAG: UDP-N-acetylmuramoyl-L-alanine--D-glutamate ligase [Candidatus Hydrogenedentes bacterium]|nr:UDP-N-acetylmuramoyl-L-alanine--D-glutamate ligase [Candidatus Hydrogenedentota bacterium]